MALWAILEALGSSGKVGDPAKLNSGFVQLLPPPSGQSR